MNILTIAGNELRRMFQGPLAWLILATVQFLLAIFFFVILSRVTEPAAWNSGRGLTEVAAVGLFQIAGVILLLIVPFITMRLFSEEMRRGTMQLLLSAPVSLTELVVGKFLGAFGFMLILLAMVALMPLTMLWSSHLDLAHFAICLLAVTLLSAALVAVGLFVSTLTDQPGLAAVMSFGLLFMLWIIHVADSGAGPIGTAVLQYLSLLRHYESLLSGLFSSVDVSYFLILVTTSLALAVWRLDMRRALS